MHKILTGGSESLHQLEYYRMLLKQIPASKSTLWKSGVCTMTCIAQAHSVTYTGDVPVLPSQNPKMKAARNKAAIQLHDRWATLLS